MIARVHALLGGALLFTMGLAGCVGGEDVDLNSLEGLSIVVTPASGDADTEFTFDASGTPGADSLMFTWDFGDGGNATGATVTHVFAYTNNLYKVTVTAVAGNQTLRETIEVPVGTGENTRPVVALHAGAHWIAHGEPLEIHADTSDADGDPVTVEWLLSKNMAEGGGHAHAPGEEHGGGHGAGEVNQFGIPEPTGQTGETSTFSFNESGTYRITARALDPKGGKAETSLDVKVTQTVPKTTFNYVQTGELLVGNAGAGASLQLYEILQPSQNTFIDSARYDLRLLYEGTGLFAISWNDSAGPADLDAVLLDEGGREVAALTATDPTGTSESTDVTLRPGSYTIEIRAKAGVSVPYEVVLDLALTVPGLNDAGADDGHDHAH